MSNKPILFLSSSRLVGELANLYKLLKIGKILDLTDNKLEENEVARYIDYDFIICDLKNDEAVKKLRLINPQQVIKVCIVRKYESANSAFVEKLKPDYTIKEFNFIQDCRTKAEVFNFIQHLNNFKKPDLDVSFYGKKIWNFLFSCIKSIN